MSKNTKRAISIVSVITVCVVVIAALSGCSLKKPIDKMHDDIFESKNYEMKMTMENVPFVGSLSSVVQVEGDINYTLPGSMDEENYRQEVDGVEYKYKKDEAGNWIKEENKDASTSTINELEQKLKSENFEKVKNSDNQYKLKEGITLEDIDDVLITIDDESYTLSGNMTMKAEENSFFDSDMKIKLTIEISKVGEIKLELPEVK